MAWESQNHPVVKVGKDLQDQQIPPFTKHHHKVPRPFIPETPLGMMTMHFTGQSVPMLNHSFNAEHFPNIQAEFPLAQLEAIFLFSYS